MLLLKGTNSVNVNTFQTQQKRTPRCRVSFFHAYEVSCRTWAKEVTLRRTPVSCVTTNQAWAIRPDSGSPVVR